MSGSTKPTLDAGHSTLTPAARTIRDSVNIQTKAMTPAEVARLAAEEPQHHEAYEFVYDDPGRVLPAAEVEVLATSIWISARKLLREHPAMSDDDVAKRIRAEGSAQDTFASRSHPKLFAMLVRRSSTDSTFTNLMTMIKTKHAIEVGAVDEEEAIARLQKHILQQCVRSSQPAKPR